MGEGCEAAPGSNELFINTAKEEADHAQKKCLLQICPSDLYMGHRGLPEEQNWER